MITVFIFINSVAVIICLIIIFMDKVVSNYKDSNINVNNEKDFVVEGGKSLLRSLTEKKLFLPSGCGGKGTCGFCKANVVEGGGKVLPTEKMFLSRSEIRQGVRLACQVKVREDLKIIVPQEYFNVKQYDAVVSYSEQVTPDIKKIKLILPDKEEMTFKPGQYLQINVDTGSEIESRAYSLASSPDSGNEVEINIKLIPEGIGSTYMHERKVNDVVSISGPYGDFFLQDTKARIICVGGGVGLAPMNSIVAYWQAHCSDRILELYYGARTMKDLYNHDMFVEIASKFENFKYHPALSDPEPEWKGAKGFIHQIMDKEMEDKDTKEAYLCGPLIMIEAVMKVLKSKGVDENKTWYDKF